MFEAHLETIWIIAWIYIWAIAFSAHEFHPFIVIVFTIVLVVVLSNFIYQSYIKSIDIVAWWSE